MWFVDNDQIWLNHHHPFSDYKWDPPPYYVCFSLDEDCYLQIHRRGGKLGKWFGFAPNLILVDGLNYRDFELKSTDLEEAKLELVNMVEKELKTGKFEPQYVTDFYLAKMNDWKTNRPAASTQEEYSKQYVENCESFKKRILDLSQKN